MGEDVHGFDHTVLLIDLETADLRAIEPDADHLDMGARQPRFDGRFIYRLLNVGKRYKPSESF